jgi:hypothetical protein
MKYSSLRWARPFTRGVGALQDGGLADAVAAWWWVGAGIAGTVTFLAATRLGATAAVPYTVVTIALLILAAAIRGRRRWAAAVSLLLLSVQPAGVVGSTIELVQADESAKAETLRALGVDPTVGTLLNLTYSAIASALCVWAVVNGARMARSRSRRFTTAPVPAPVLPRTRGGGPDKQAAHTRPVDNPWEGPLRRSPGQGRRLP